MLLPTRYDNALAPTTRQAMPVTSCFQCAGSECTWSVYRGRLTFKAIAGRQSLLCDAGVWVRSG